MSPECHLTFSRRLIIHEFAFSSSALQLMASDGMSLLLSSMPIRLSKTSESPVRPSHIPSGYNSDYLYSGCAAWGVSAIRPAAERVPMFAAPQIAADSSESRRRCRAFRMQYRKAPRRQAERLLLLIKPALQVRPYSRPASCSLSRRNWYFSYASLTFLT